MRFPPRSAGARPAALVLLLLTAAGCVESPAGPLPGNLVGEIEPRRSPGVWHAGRLADGMAANEGDHWQTGVTAQVTARGLVEWDLGKSTPIRCAIIQGDNNDMYRLFASEDGKDFAQVWVAGPDSQPGMRTRFGGLSGTARYLRLTADGGDGMYSVGEIVVFAACPTGWPDVKLQRVRGIPLNDVARTDLWLFAAVTIAFLLAHRRSGSRWQYLMAAVPLVVGVRAVMTLVEIYPIFGEESLLRGLVALIALAVVVKEGFFPERHRAHPWVVKVTLGLLAVLAVGCYYHFAAPQFYDVSKGRRTFVHTVDMRHYYPTAKYFHELRFDGLYLASLAAYIDLARPRDLRADMRDVHLRDLTTYDMITGEQALPQLPPIRARFTPQRWEQFKGDMKYFLDSMGRDLYLGSMRDHGGNATPVWVLGAWALFRGLQASELTLGLGGAVDPVLLLVLFFFVYRTFGSTVMLYGLIIFGATDFYQFGSNLVGSTLRQDWLVALGLGACALKAGRPFLGGFLMAYGGLIRAFPALAALFLMVPVAWYIIDHLRQHRRLPALAALRADLRPALRAIAGAATAVISFVAVTSAVFGLKNGWATWISKIELHAVGPSTNNVGLRNVLAWRPWHTAGYLTRHEHREPWADWQRYQIENFAQLRPLFYLINLLVFAAVFIAARRRPLHQVALLGLLLVPFFFYPSNYYCHFVFLLPMAFAGAAARAGAGTSGDPGRDRVFAWSMAVLCAMCFGQYFSYFAGGTDEMFTAQSFMLLVGFILLMVPVAREGWRTLRPAPSPVAASDPVV
jgi:hypothetical protein